MLHHNDIYYFFGRETITFMKMVVPLTMKPQYQIREWNNKVRKNHKTLNLQLANTVG